MKQALTYFAGLCILAMTSTLQAAAPLDHPGYIDLNFVDEWAGGNVNVEVNISRQLLRLAGIIAATEEPEAAETIKKLEHISVRILEDIPKDKQNDFLQWAQEKSVDLRKKGWEPVASVRENGKENINIMMLLDDDTISGILVTIVDGDEAIFVNVVGNVDFESLADIGKKFDIPGLDEGLGVKKKSTGNK